MLKRFPKYIVKTLYLLKALSPRDVVKMYQNIMHLWLEFRIGVQIDVVVKHYVIKFRHKDEPDDTYKVKDLKEIFQYLKKAKETHLEIIEDAPHNDRDI